MALTKQEVLHMASLCRIALSPQEVEYLRGQLSDILEHVRTLQEVDTDQPDSAPDISAWLMPGGAGDQV